MVLMTRAQLCLGFKAVERLKGGDKRGLHDLFRIIGLLEQAHHQPVDAIGIRFKELGECRFLMPAESSQQVLIIRQR